MLQKHLLQLHRYWQTGKTRPGLVSIACDLCRTIFLSPWASLAKSLLGKTSRQIVKKSPYKHKLNNLQKVLQASPSQTYPHPHPPKKNPAHTPALRKCPLRIILRWFRGPPLVTSVPRKEEGWQELGSYTGEMLYDQDQCRHQGRPSTVTREKPPHWLSNTK